MSVATQKSGFLPRWGTLTHVELRGDRHSQSRSLDAGDRVARHAQYEVGRDYVLSGISVIPLRSDGSKAPATRSWNEYRTRFAFSSELCQWFTRPAGIGLVCGVQSGGLEALDFDERADEIFWAWVEQLPTDLFSCLSVVETGGFGYHVLYRCDRVTGNTKIAMTANGGVLIESRGEGGYIVAAGSDNAVHSSGRPYVQVRGVPLPEIRKITPQERKKLWCVAASLDERVDPLVDYVRHRRSERYVSSGLDGATP